MIYSCRVCKSNYQQCTLIVCKLPTKLDAKSVKVKKSLKVIWKSKLCARRTGSLLISTATSSLIYFITVTETIVWRQKADSFDAARVTMKCGNAGLGGNIPQCNVLVSTSGHKLVLTRHPVHVKYCILMRLPIYKQQTPAHAASENFRQHKSGTVRIHFPFSALTLWLLVGRQKGHLACKRIGCWFVGGDILTGALHVL